MRILIQNTGALWNISFMGINEIYFQIADTANAEQIANLVNSAYRGESSKRGWTTEADLLGGQRTDAARIRECILRPHSVIILVLNVNHILGCVHVEQVGRECHLGMITVEPQYQGVGLGKKIVAAAEQFALEKWKSEAISMSVITLRTELISWYERRGYLKTGKFENFPYDDQGFGIPKREDLRFEILRKVF